VLAPLLRPPQRRLLALGLALSRAPSWARSPQFAVALNEIDQVLLNASARPPEVPVAPPRAAEHPRAEAVPIGPPLGDEPAQRQPPQDAEEGGAAPPPAPEQPRAIAQRRLELARVAFGDRAPIAAPAAERPPAEHTEEARVEAPSIAPASAKRPARLLSIEQAPRVRTRFGGVFYLLNAALAMQLYSDFTSPRGANLRLSPWNWLALIGREWFGREFVRDPVWRLLADLSGRGRRYLRRPRRLPAQVEALLARLALALGGDRPADIPAIVCRHSAGISVTESRVDVHLALSDLPLALRVAGLDRDPGWIPAAGRSVAFHFE